MLIVYFNTHNSTHNQKRKTNNTHRKQTTIYCLYNKQGNLLSSTARNVISLRNRRKVFRTLALCLPVFPYEMLLLTSICCNRKLELYAKIVYYILDVLDVKYCHIVVLLYNFNFVIKFSLLFLNFEVVLTNWASDWSVDDCCENCSFHH